MANRRRRAKNNSWDKRIVHKWLEVPWMTTNRVLLYQPYELLTLYKSHYLTVYYSIIATNKSLYFNKLTLLNHLRQR